LPEGREALDNKWVFKLKDREDGSCRFKARLVVKGFLQKPGVDFEETFAPVLKLQSLRILLAIANQRKMHIHQMDVKTAFLYGNLKEEIFMKQPEGFVVKGKENLVCKLKKSLYGLKQAPRCWNETFNNFCTKKLGFLKCQKDTATYVRGNGNKKSYIGVYVDDLIIVSEDLDEISRIKSAFKREFDMQDFGTLSTVLGMKVDYDRESGILSLSQKKYAEEIVRKFGMENATGVVTPLPTGQKLTTRMCPQNDKERAEMNRVPYRSAVGSVMYLMTCTRPDLATAVGIVSRFL
jgi:hypothetical protein